MQITTENGKHHSVIFATKKREKENLFLPKQTSEELYQTKLDRKNRAISKLKSKVFQIEDAIQQYDNFMKKIINILDPNIKREMTGEYEDMKKLFFLYEGKVSEEETRSPSKTPTSGVTPTRSRPSLRTPLRTRVTVEEAENGGMENKEEFRVLFMELYDENIRLKEELNDKMDEIDYLSAQIQENKPSPPISRSLSNFSSPIVSTGSLSKQRDKKHQLLEFFTEQEVATVFENEMVSRLVTCRDLALSPNGIHPDVLTLFSFMKAGCYVTGTCYTFLGRVVKALYNMFKTSLHQEKLVFWLVQVVYLADLVAGEFNLGPGIVSHGLDFSNPSGHDGRQSGVSPVMSSARFETACRFLTDLREIAIKIYGKLVRATMDALRPVLQKLVRGSESIKPPVPDSAATCPESPPKTGSLKSSSSPSGNGGGNMTQKRSNSNGVLEEPVVPPCNGVLGKGSRPEDPTCVILATLNKHHSFFEKALLCNTLVLQYFNQVYRNMDAFMFNELFRFFPNFSGENGVSIKLGISQLNWWKYENLRKYYTSKENPHRDFRWLPLSEIGVFDYLSQAINVLVLDKALFEDENFVEQHFHNLSPNHLYELLARFVPDAMSPHEVPSELLEKLKAQCKGQEMVPLDEAQNYSILARRENESGFFKNQKKK